MRWPVLKNVHSSRSKNIFRGFLVAVLTAMLLPSFACSQNNELQTAEGKFERVLSTHGQELIAQATGAQAFRIDPWLYMPEDSTESEPELLVYHKIEERGPMLTSKQLERVQELLLDSRGYIDPDLGGKLCIFVPRHALLMECEQEPLVVLVCFECAQIAFMTLDEYHYGGGDMDYMSAELRKVFTELFPNESPADH